MPTPTRGQQLGELAGLFGVVVDQQPPPLPAQLVEQRGHGLGLVGRHRDAQPARQRGQRRAAVAGCSAGTHQVTS